MLRRPISALYVDASVLINLIGTDVAVEVLRSVGVPVVAARPAADEVVRDPQKKSNGPERLRELVQAGALQISELGPEHWERHIELIGAPPPDDLGDGESATICMAECASAAVVLDDTKAIRIVGQRFPKIQQIYTVDLFVYAWRSGVLTLDVCRKALRDAHALSRMRVPHVRVVELRELKLWGE